MTINRKRWLLMMLYAATLAWTPAATLASQSETQRLIEQALDEPTRILLENVKLRDAINQITEQTGVLVVMPDEAMALVPYGPDTVIEKVDIDNVSLRSGLTDLFAPLGMTFTVGKEAVEVTPKPALLCLGRAPTWEELDTLMILSAMEPGVDPQARESLLARLQFHLPVASARDLMANAIHTVGSGSGEVVLDITCQNLGWAWCLSGSKIIITPLEQHIQRQIAHPISLRVRNRPLFEALQIVGDAAHIKVRLEPGALQAVSDVVRRSFSITAQDQSAEEVFEAISAYTGLGYLIAPDGVLFYNPEGIRKAAPATPAAASDPYVAKIARALPDGKVVEWLVRASELPPDLHELRKHDINEMIKELRLEMIGQE